MRLSACGSLSSGVTGWTAIGSWFRPLRLPRPRRSTCSPSRLLRYEEGFDFYDCPERVRHSVLTEFFEIE